MKSSVTRIDFIRKWPRLWRSKLLRCPKRKSSSGKGESAEQIPASSSPAQDRPRRPRLAREGLTEATLHRQHERKSSHSSSLFRARRGAERSGAKDAADEMMVSSGENRRRGYAQRTAEHAQGTQVGVVRERGVLWCRRRHGSEQPLIEPSGAHRFHVFVERDDNCAKFSGSDD